MFSEQQARAEAHKPAALRILPGKEWVLCTSDMLDTRPIHTFSLSLRWDTPFTFRKQAEKILLRQQPKAMIYMTSTPPKRTVLYAAICYMTNKKNPPQEPRIKRQYSIDDPVQWAVFTHDVSRMKHPLWAAALFEMDHPDSSLGALQAAYDESAALAAWEADRDLGARPQLTLPAASDPQAKYELGCLLKDKYKSGGGSGDNMIVKRKDHPGFTFRLTAHRIGLWADAMVSFTHFLLLISLPPSKTTDRHL